MAETGRDGLVIGVTGAPGSGKTSVAEGFARLGARPISLDEIGHELLSCPEVCEEIHETFSAGVIRILDGKVSRERLGRLVFSDPEDLAKLNRIMHPRMVERVRVEVDRWREGLERGGPPALLIEGALLIEMGLDRLCDRVVLVRASRETRLERLGRSRSWDETELARRELAQMTDDSRRERASAVLDNDSDIAALHRQAEALWEEWK